MKRLLLIGLSALAAGCGTDTENPSVEVSVSIPDKNGSGIFGSADVSRVDDTHVKIDVDLEGALPERELPAYVIIGGCTAFDPEVTHELDPVADGESSSEIDLPMADITTGSYALAVGSKDPMKYVACGNIVP